MILLLALHNNKGMLDTGPQVPERYKIHGDMNKEYNWDQDCNFTFFQHAKMHIFFKNA